MSIDPRVALQSLVAALEEHLAASASRRREDDPAVEAAYLGIADAFEAYEEALYDSFGEVTPLEIYEDDDDDASDDEDPDGISDELESEQDESDDDAPGDVQVDLRN
jgi:hypothetical protein